MGIGKIEFVIVVGVVSAYMIFTPEPLVLFRNLCIWGLFPLMAWHGYDSWESSPWTRKIITTVVTGGGFGDLAGMVWAKSLSTGASRIRQGFALFYTEAYNWLNDLLHWPRDKPSPSSPSPSQRL